MLFWKLTFMADYFEFVEVCNLVLFLHREFRSVDYVLLDCFLFCLLQAIFK